MDSGCGLGDSTLGWKSESIKRRLETQERKRRREEPNQPTSSEELIDGRRGRRREEEEEEVGEVDGTFLAVLLGGAGGQVG